MPLKNLNSFIEELSAQAKTPALIHDTDSHYIGPYVFFARNDGLEPAEPGTNSAVMGSISVLI